MRPASVRRRERGVALLLVLIAVVLIAALATEVSQTAVTQHRLGKNTMNEFLLRTAADGRAHILRSSLKWDASAGQSIDTEDEDWSWYNHERLSDWGKRSPEDLGDSSGDEAIQYENENVEILAWCEDERSKLNLLGLSRPRDTPEFRHTRDALIRLIDEFREDWSSLDKSEADAQEMVEDLVEWLEARTEEDENPMPPVASGRGRLQSVDDLLRVAGGKWTEDVLYDVEDPDVDPDAPEEEVEEGSDDEFSRMNGIPGLWNFLTVHAESQPNAPLRININTAREPVLRALFDLRDADLAEAIIENRREGAGSWRDDSSGGAEEDEDSGFFTSKTQMTRVEGMAEDLDAYPRLDFFADTRSNVFSLRVVTAIQTGIEEGEFDEDDPDSEGPKEIAARYQYREVVQRTDEGLITLLVERRQDPVY